MKNNHISLTPTTFMVTKDISFIGVMIDDYDEGCRQLKVIKITVIYKLQIDIVKNSKEFKSQLNCQTQMKFQDHRL